MIHKIILDENVQDRLNKEGWLHVLDYENVPFLINLKKIDSLDVLTNNTLEIGFVRNADKISNPDDYAYPYGISMKFSSSKERDQFVQVITNSDIVENIEPTE